MNTQQMLYLNLNFALIFFFVGKYKKKKVI